MPQWIAVERPDKLQPGQPRDYELLDGTMLGLVAIDGAVIAFDATCPHRGGPLARGAVTDGLVRCPWHGYCFRLADGRQMTPAADQAIRLFPVRLRDGWVEVQVP